MQAQSSEAGQSRPFQILAPIDGYVLNVQEENARVVAAGDAIMEVGDTRDLEIRGRTTVSDAVALVSGAPVCH
jgi:HlyD family secretion protein